MDSHIPYTCTPMFFVWFKRMENKNFTTIKEGGKMHYEKNMAFKHISTLAILNTRFLFINAWMK
jgi:hypothetical protein